MIKKADDIGLPIAYEDPEIMGRGFVSTEMTQDFDHTEPEPEIEQNDLDAVPSYKEVIDMLVNMGDQFDTEDNETFANFTDFLIKKFAETRDINYTKLYNDLMLKINNADLANTSEILKKLTKIYSRTILLELGRQGDMQLAKKSAYKKIVHRADQYISDPKV
jgi:hypothetical protein